MRVLLGLVVLMQVGCAAIFTGTKQEISITSAPPGATVVVVGGTPAALALKAKKVSDFKDKIVNMLGGALPPDAKALLLTLSIEELITQLVLWTKASDLPPEMVGKAGRAFDGVPSIIRDKVTDYLGLEGLGTTPSKQTLGKGHNYAVVAWAKGYRARLIEVDTKFNWVVLLNIFNGILPGLIVDGLTGAWLNLTPDEVALDLEPLPAPPAAPGAP